MYIITSNFFNKNEYKYIESDDMISILLDLEKYQKNHPDYSDIYKKSMVFLQKLDSDYDTELKSVNQKFFSNIPLWSVRINYQKKIFQKIFTKDLSSINVTNDDTAFSRNDNNQLQRFKI